MKLIVTSILVFLGLFAAYHVAVKRLPPRLASGDMAGSQPERNLMRAQAYVHTRNDPPVVVVGSSISERLLDLPAGWYKLSFPGGNAFTGMEIVLRSGKHPKYVMVETNVLNMDPDRRMLDSLFSPGFKTARDKLPELMETSKPSHVAVRAMAMGKDHKPSTGEGVSREFFDTLIHRRMGELSEPVDAKRLDEIASRLKRDVTALESQGIRVVFFEMPELPGAEGQPLKVSIRERVRIDFPPSRYAWIPDSDATRFQTTDAVHLNPASAKQYCGIVSEFMTSLAGDGPKSAPTVASKPTTRPALGTQSPAAPSAAEANLGQ